jgi:hypothetical protein
MSEKVFVPYPPCSVTSGDCFVQGRCLDRCKKRNATITLAQCRELAERMVQLEIRILRLEGKKP